MDLENTPHQEASKGGSPPQDDISDEEWREFKEATGFAGSREEATPEMRETCLRLLADDPECDRLMSWGPQFWGKCRDAARCSSNLTDGQYRVLDAVLSFGDPDGGNAFPSAKRIGGKCGKSPTQVRRFIRQLRERGWLGVTPVVRGNGRQSSNLYRFHIPAGEKGGPLEGALRHDNMNEGYEPVERATISLGWEQAWEAGMERYRRTPSPTPTLKSRGLPLEGTQDVSSERTPTGVL